MGELHPKVRGQYDWASNFKAPVLAADLDLELLIKLIPALYQTKSDSNFSINSARQQPNLCSMPREFPDGRTANSG